jgi:hypothetical protein
MVLFFSDEIVFNVYEEWKEKKTNGEKREREFNQMSQRRVAKKVEWKMSEIKNSNVILVNIAVVMQLVSLRWFQKPLLKLSKLSVLLQQQSL